MYQSEGSKGRDGGSPFGGVLPSSLLTYMKSFFSSHPEFSSGSSSTHNGQTGIYGQFCSICFKLVQKQCEFHLLGWWWRSETVWAIFSNLFVSNRFRSSYISSIAFTLAGGGKSVKKYEQFQTIYLFQTGSEAHIWAAWISPWLVVEERVGWLSSV